MNDNLSSRIAQNHDDIAALKVKLKACKKNKAEVARQFKHTDAGSAAHAELLSAMQQVSAELKTIEAELKQAEKVQQEEPQSTNSAPLDTPLLIVPHERQFAPEFKIREITQDELADWYRYLDTQQPVSAYHQPAWAEVTEQAFAHPTRVWAAFSADNQIIGGVPLTFFNSRLFGKFAVSIPYVNYGGVVSAYFNVAQALLGYLSDLCQREALGYIEVRTLTPELAAQASSKKASMILPLPTTTEALDEQLGAKVRAQYHKAEEHKPRIAFGKLALLDDFYRVFAKNMRDLGTPVYGKYWFRQILSHTAINAVVAVVYVNNQPVSAGFLVGHNQMLEIPWASTIKEANVLNTNMWMYRQILGYAIQEGYAFFDFGRSTQDAGTYKFKKQWGARPHIHYWYKILPASSQAAPELNPDNPKFALMINIWKRLPVWLTQLIGPPIIKDIP